MLVPNGVRYREVPLYLTFNASKCKYMVISRRRQGYCHPPDLLLDDSCLERVESFKYLGILLSSDLSWSKHIESFCTKAHKLLQLGLLYRRFYKHAEPPALFFLPLFFYHARVELALMPICNLLPTQTLMFLALFHYGIHYLVMSLAYLHFLFLKPTYNALNLFS